MVFPWHFAANEIAQVSSSDLGYFILSYIYCR